MLKSSWVRAALFLPWLAAVGTGFTLLARYQNATGPVGQSPSDWPAHSHAVLDHKRDTMLMFAHPQCPCTRASIEELNRLLARSSGSAPSVQVWFLKPAGFSAEWVRSDLWRSASAIPGVTVQVDDHGAEAKLFGAETSGYVMLYDPHGKLRFKGGITGSRGHAGDNPGEDTIVSLLDGQSSSMSQTPVYGCSLLGQCSAASQQSSQ